MIIFGFYVLIWYEWTTVAEYNCDMIEKNILSSKIVFE